MFSLFFQTFWVFHSAFIIKPIVFNVDTVYLKRYLEIEGEYIDLITLPTKVRLVKAMVFQSCMDVRVGL